MSEPKLELSYSKCSTFLHCRQRYNWVYTHKLVPKKKSTPLQVGDIVHRLLDLYYQGALDTNDLPLLHKKVQELFPDNTEEESFDVAVLSGMLLQGYVNEHQEDELRVISPEMHLEKDFPEFKLYSRVDAMCMSKDDRLWRMEHKTTSRYDSTYLKGLRRGLQTGIAHWLLEEVVDEKITGTVFNLLVKTKVPQFPRNFITKEPWAIKLAKEVVHGIVRSINRGDFYPSADCNIYNSDCDYMTLCRSDTKENREAFYTIRQKGKTTSSITLKEEEEVTEKA